MRVLIGTLYSGEPQFTRCLRSLENQTYANWRHCVISHYPNRDAHSLLYRAFMYAEAEFDLYIKLDADMEFQRPSALAEIVAMFSENRQLGHIEAAVYDYFSDSRIMGLHAFRAGAFWPDQNEEIFVDSKPVSNGRHQMLWDTPAPFVNHCLNPNQSQAYYFGYHRATKIRQWGYGRFRPAQARAQLRLLYRIRNHHFRNGDPFLLAALSGALDGLRLRANLSKHTKASFYAREKASTLRVTRRFWRSSLVRTFLFLYVETRCILSLFQRLYNKIRT